MTDSAACPGFEDEEPARDTTGTAGGGRGGGDAEDGGRAISPVLGTVLMVALTILLASVVSAGLISTGQTLEEPDIQGPTETVSGNPWVGSLSDLVTLSDNTAGATDVRYRTNFTVQSGSDTVGNSLNSVQLRMDDTSLAIFADTGQSSLGTATVDTDGDGVGEQDISDDLNGWEVNNGGSEVKIKFGGEYTAEAGDSVIITFDDVDNPASAGTYGLEIQTSGDGNWQNGSIEIVAD